MLINGNAEVMMVEDTVVEALARQKIQQIAFPFILKKKILSHCCERFTKQITTSSIVEYLPNIVLMNFKY